ncbi:MAG: single-stranded DNA-binding protein [Magnetococcales bacterium]|nr:single-stranded DNA-binding protein [Magnetococcales bacterium]MBF0262733.1 single-stranded DNA-binding protein [Magnetococcales bacterium]
MAGEARPNPVVTVSEATRAVNSVELEGRLIEPVDFRVTPAGRSVATLELEHLSIHDDPEPGLRLEARMVVVAMGALAERYRACAVGSMLRVQGRLNQKRWIRDDRIRWGRLELLAREIQRVDP